METTETCQAQGLLHGLNERQRLAVQHGRGPLLVVAGAGTGKTATLAHRVAHLIAQGTDPGRILLLTFTRRAAAEMLRRVEAILRALASAQLGPPDARDSALTPTAAAPLGPTAASRSTTASPSAAAPGSEAAPASMPLPGPETASASTATRGPAARSGLSPQRAAKAASRVWGGTFHAVATRLLRLHGRMIGLNPAFTILDRSDAEDMLGVLRTELGLAKSDRRFPLKGTCMDIYSRCVNARQTVEEAVETCFPWCRDDVDDLRLLFSHYVDRKGAQNVLDYDDLLLYWHGLLSDARAGASVRRRFDYVLVDEYQDTNTLQAEILKMLCPEGEGLTVVGDDAQAIYSFRAATVRNMLDFPTLFPGTTVLTLEQNYRSTQPLLEATNAVIAEASERYVKQLWSESKTGAKPQLVFCEDEDEQSEELIRHILEHRESGLALRRQAVLFRASHHSLALELELARRNIPFRKYGGLRFVETAHVKDLLAFLRLAENPRDLMAGTRILMLLPGVGPKKARALMDYLGSHQASPPAPQQSGAGGPTEGFAAWRRCPPPSVAAAEYWQRLVELMTCLGGSSRGDLPSQINLIRRFYAPLLERLYDNARARLLDLEQLERLASRFSDRARFLAELALDPPTYTEDFAGPPVLDEDYLVLSTMHSAKGLEWDTVYVIHAADGNIPSDLATGRPEEIEEERRLFYVALTRAKEWLYVFYPLRYYSYPRSFSDTHGYAQLTRFLPDRVQHYFEIRQAGDLRSEDPTHGLSESEQAQTHSRITTEDIRQRLKKLL